MKHKKIFKNTFYTILMILTLIYLVYRILFTLPMNLGILALITAIIVLLIEIWESCDFFIYYLNILCTNKKTPKLPDISDITEFPDIDIFIATINESELLLANTINACKSLEYPDNSKIHIYLCDDGNRNNIKKLANDMNINYLARLSNKHAKAGNYNYALYNTNSPYIATFDADMAPTPDFLLVTLPYFLNTHKKMGFVQLPQSFTNPDIFQYRFNLTKKIPFEQDYFYHRIQIAKNNTNSTIYCGTNTLFAREALESTKGFATKTISEDIATGMLIEANGYTGLATNRVAAYGLCVDDLTGFVKQRARWARGCVQILKKYDILKNKGLSLRQKLEYLSCISYWFFGVRRMVYLLTPLLFSIFGIIIVDCDLMTFIALWLPTYILKRFALDMLEKNKRSSTWNKIYETILTPILFKEVLKEFFGFGNTKFEVTPKYGINSKMSKINKKLLCSHLILLILNIVGLVMCFTRLSNSTLSIYVLSLLWIFSNIFYLTISIIFDLRTKNYNYKDFIPNQITKYKKGSVLAILFGKKKSIN